MITIKLDDEQIRDAAFVISQETHSYDELVWLFAEAELRILSALVMGNLSQQDVGETRKVDVDPYLLVDQPPEEEIRVLAEEIAQLKPTLQELHWFVAERRFIYDRAKANLG